MKRTYLVLPYTETRKFNQQSNKPNICINAEHTNLKKEPEAVAVALKDQIEHLKMAN
jgi:hypothetical protein